MEIRTIMVIGAGQMGSGIAQVAAEAKYNVLLCDLEAAYLTRAVQSIDRLLSRAVEKGKLPAVERQEILARIATTTELDRAVEVELVVEAVTENVEVKKGIFLQLDKICAAHTILASNTSSIPLTQLASFTKRPSRVVGMHFMNPVPLMQLVEVIRAQATSDETFSAAMSVVARMGKTGVEVNDFPGFVINRVLIPMINEAAFCLQEGVASAEAIDTVMKLGANHPLGPLALADLIGLDVCLSIMEILHAGLGDKYRPAPMLRRLVQAGHLGRKTGRGFHAYK
ncbi:MAG: putative 3-hydroxybutyryl-CoA dehydrogenase [Firmicutes bacterium]|nr:putative 3-hydroxybutyryl-CoA dehydrogenase [Bacillota bacterium]